MDAPRDLDIIALLRDEHEDLRLLFRAVFNAEVQTRIEPFRNLASRLVTHAMPTERMLAALEDMESSTDEFVAALQELEVVVFARAAFEERQEFPLLAEHLAITR